MRPICEAKFSEWREVQLRDVARIRRGASPRPIDSPRWFAEKGPGWVRISDVTRANGQLRTTEQYLSQDGVDRSVRIGYGDVIMSICATIGEPVIVGMDACIHDGFVVFDNFEGALDRQFLLHLLRKIAPEFKASGQTGTQANLNTGIVNAKVVTIPRETREQTRIAAVLDTMDEAIAKTEAVIAKLKQVRTGLLHDLLTRGLDEHGQLRDPVAHPEQFQDSPVGRIPKEWTFETLGDRLKQNSGTIQTGPFGSQLHAHEYRTQGIPVIMPQDIREGDFDDSQIARIPLATAEGSRRHWVRQGDLIFARRGDLSRCAAVTEREVGWLCGTGCLLLRFEQGNLLPMWLSLAYRHDFGQRQIAARAVGTTMVNLNTTLLVHLVFAFPRKEEQQEMVRQVGEAVSTIHKALENLSKLGLLKSGLMNDLLTGRVRVLEGMAITE